MTLQSRTRASVHSRAQLLASMPRILLSVKYEYHTGCRGERRDVSTASSSRSHPTWLASMLTRQLVMQPARLLCTRL